jgi:hypothetical protein
MRNMIKRRGWDFKEKWSGHSIGAKSSIHFVPLMSFMFLLSKFPAFKSSESC